MAETPETTVKPQMDREELVRVGRELGQAFDGLATLFKASAKRTQEKQEAGALFELYRQRRQADAPGSPNRDKREEMDARLAAALEGYPTDLLSDLIVFGQWLSESGQPIWQARTR